MALFKKDFMNRALIIGASGLLGRAIVDELISKDYYVGSLSRNSINIESSYLKEHLIDVLDYRKLEIVISEYDFIINCTGQITNPISNCLALNTDGIQNIVDAAKKYNKQLLHFSSVSVYGSAEFVNEESNLNPETIYASLKCFSEHIIKKNLKDCIIFRVSNLYGKNQKKGVVGYLVNQYINNLTDLSFNNNGDMRRYYLNVSQLAEIAFYALEEDLKPGIYNVIGEDNLSIKELVEKFNSNLNYCFSAKYEKSLPLENINKIDCSKIKRELNLPRNTLIDLFIKNVKDEKY